jgi:hypothetical protein
MTAGLAAVQECSVSTVAVLGYSGTVAIGHLLPTSSGNGHRAPDGPRPTATVHFLPRTDPFPEAIA